MTEFPSWNYWRWKEATNYFDWELDAKIGELDEYDLRSEEYACDPIRDVCEMNYWDAHQAAALCFGRDPSGVSLDEDAFNGDPTAESSKLREHIRSLKELIQASQAERNLPQQILHKDLYLEWADRMGVDTSHLRYYVAEYAKPGHGIFGASSGVVSGVTFGDRQSANGGDIEQKLSSQQRKVHNNLLRIILALIHDRKESTSDLAKKIKKTLSDLASSHNDEEFNHGSSRIEMRLAEARDLIGKS